MMARKKKRLLEAYRNQMGKGKILKLRKDGMVEIELFWRLAQGSKAYVYQPASNVKKNINKEVLQYL